MPIVALLLADCCSYGDDIFTGFYEGYRHYDFVKPKFKSSLQVEFPYLKPVLNTSFVKLFLSEHLNSL